MITFITGNKHKVIEAENIFKDYDINLEHIDLGYCEPQGTLEEVAISGAKYASRKLNKPVIVEDAGLFIKALKGFPGTYSSYVQETLGNQGILKLLDGEIAVEEKGDLGFAFDPIFYVPNEGKTFGELTTEEKNQFSHRKNSLEKFIKWYSIQ